MKKEDIRVAIESVDVLLDNMELLRKQVELNAVLRRVAYEALIKTGFTEEQALDIVKHTNPLG